MKKLYVFGNEYLEEDSLARTISGDLDCEIIHCRSPDDLLHVDDSSILILDVVKGIERTTVITDLTRLHVPNMVSLHDFDLGYFLILMRTMGIQKNIKILGIPLRGSKEKTIKEVKQCLKEMD